MKFTAVVTAHDEDVANILDNLEQQTQRPDEVLLFWSGNSGHRGRPLFWDDQIGMIDTDLALRAIKQPNKNDWGHDKRDRGLKLAQGDYIGFFNADDRYAENYIGTMMKAAERDRAGLVYCFWHPMGPCIAALGSSTSGNFIVHRDVAAEAGGWTSRRYEADGDFIEEAVRASQRLGKRVTQVPHTLYWHNP